MFLIWLAVLLAVLTEAKDSNVALLRPAEQSSTFADRMASLAVDGNLDSCSSTEDKNSGDSQRFWSVQLQTAVNIKEVWVTLNHGVAFHQEFTVFVIARSGDNRTKFHKCASFAGILGQRQRLKCPPGGIVGEKVYIRDDRRQGSLSLCEVEVMAHSGAGICTEPPGITNGKISVLGGTQQQLQYQCHPGFILWGPTNLVCLANNTWSSPPPICSPMTCGYPHVEDPHAVIEQSSYNIQRRQGAQIGDRAIVVCQAGYQMVINTSTASEAVHQVSVTCSLEGMWEKDHLYRCYNRSLLAQMWPSLDLSINGSGGLQGQTDNFSLHSIVFAIVSIVLFVLFCLLLTCMLRRRRMQAIKRRTEAAVSWPRNVHLEEQSRKSSQQRPLISVFTTQTSRQPLQPPHNLESSDSLMQAQQHCGSSAKLIPFEENTATIHSGLHKKMSYEDDFHLPESGSLVQGVSVDPHSAVFGHHGLRLDGKETEMMPDVANGYYHKNTTFLSSFQSPQKDLQQWNNNEVTTFNAQVMPPPPEKFTNGDLPELDEAGYASLILKTAKQPSVEKEPVYERIKGERPISQDLLTSLPLTDTVSDSGESHAYYSRVAKDLSLEPPPLKEHLYQNFDQVFLALEEKRQHPDLLRNHEQYYVNTRSLSPDSKEVVVNDEKLRHMYAQVDVIKKHFDRNNKAYQSLQVMDHSSHVPNNPDIRTAWEEQI